MATRITTRARECIVRAPADHRQFVANLHHRRPDVVEELNLDHRLQPARGHARGAAHDRGLGQRRIEDAVRAKFVLQAEGELEDSAFAFHQLPLQVFFAAAIGYVFAEDHDALVALHFVAQRYVDQIGHGLGHRLLAIGGIGRRRPPAYRTPPTWDRDRANTHTAARSRARRARLPGPDRPQSAVLLRLSFPAR